MIEFPANQTNACHSVNMASNVREKLAALSKHSGSHKDRTEK